MESVGKASLTIVPKFDNLGKTVTSALNGVNGAKAGEKTGEQYTSGFSKGTSGLVKSGAVMGVFSAATSRAMDMISSSVSGAVSRLDTLNNYPRVMQALGYSAEASESSIAKMSDHLTGLPTALNDMTSTVQGIAAVTGDLDQATAAGLALNDMLLASGSSTALTSAAMEQFRQMLAKGKPEMQDWKSLTSAMPGQMNQLAQSLLGPTANANDLYEALGGGGAEATISMDALMAKMVELDTTGTESFTSFADQAKNATGGIESSISNMETAIARGMAGVMDSIGSDTISGAIKGVGGAFESALGLVGAAIETAKPYIGGFVGLLKDIGPSAVPAIAGLAGLAAAGKGLGGLASAVANASNAFGGIKGVAKGASESLLSLSASMKSGSRTSEALSRASGALGGAMGGPLVVGIGLAVAAAGLLAGAYMDSEKRSKTFEKATAGLSDAVKAADSPIRGIAGAYDSLAESADKASVSLGDVKDRVGEAMESQADLATSMQERNDAMNTSVGLLETYKDTISEHANQTNLDAREQMELKFAIEQVNEQCGTQYEVIDAANGVIADQNGIVQENTDEILKNIDARQSQLRVQALEENYKDTYKQQYEDLQVLNDAKHAQTLAQEQYDDALARGAKNSQQGNEILKQYKHNLDDANEATETAQRLYDESSASLDAITKGMVDASSGADVLRVAIEAMGDGVSKAAGDVGLDVESLSTELANAGISAEEMSKISKDAFADMLSGSGGDITKLTAMIELYNSVPLIDKDGNVNIEDSKLVDAQGNVYTWNDGVLLDKKGVAAVNDLSLTDSQGNVWVWNGTGLDSKSAIAVVTGNAADGTAEGRVIDTRVSINSLRGKEERVQINGNYVEAGTSIWDLGSAIRNLGSKTIDIVTNFLTNGTRPNAAGGYRFHAAGAIAHKAVPLDIVGEDGAEAIVPLTNKRYSLPFARTLAEQMGEVASGGGSAAVIAWLDANLGRLIAENTPKEARVMTDKEAERWIMRTVRGNA